MTWFAVDDMFHSHPKLAELGTGKRFAEAVALWTMAGSWSALHLTDGRVKTAQLTRLVPYQPTQAANDLVRVGLWETTAEGFQFRDWADYQPTRDEVEAKREKGAARTRKSRRRASVSNDVGNASCNAVTDDVTNASETLSRPVPSRSLGERGEHPPKPSPELDQTKAAIPVDRFLASFAKPGKVTRADVARWFSDLRAKAGRGVWHWDGKSYGKHADGLQKVAKAVEAESDPEATVGAAWRGFWADEKAKAAGYPFEWFAHDFGRYVADGATAPSDVAQEIARKIGELAADSNRLQAEAGAALKRGDRAEWSRLNAESEAKAQECERLKRGNAA